MSNPAAGDTVRLPARTSALEDAFAHVRAFCVRNAIARDDAMRIKLVVEELFTNTVRHGYAAESDAPIRITLEATQEAVALVYEDEAARFDPTSRFVGSCAEHAIPLVQRPVGGLGLRLLGQLVQDARYVRHEGCNRLSLRLPRTGQRGSPT